MARQYEAWLRRVYLPKGMSLPTNEPYSQIFASNAGLEAPCQDAAHVKTLTSGCLAAWLLGGSIALQACTSLWSAISIYPSAQLHECSAYGHGTWAVTGGLV